MATPKDELTKRINESYEVPNNVVKKVPKPLVSVYVATYQHRDYITDCLEGVLMQKTTFPFELIIGEDFSTDGTRDVVMEYAKKHPELIRVITADRNVGQKANRIRCLMACRAKYVAICDGDDYWTDPLKLQKQVDFLETNPGYSLCFHAYKIKKNGVLLKPLYPRRPRDYSADELVADPGTIRVLTKLLKNIFIGKSIDELSNYYGDSSMTSVLGTYGKAKYLSDIMPSVYVHHPGGVWTTKTPEAKLFGSINAKINMYRYYLSIEDTARATICLRGLHRVLASNRSKIYPGLSRFRISRSGMHIVFAGIWFELYYRPFLLSLNKRPRR